MRILITGGAGFVGSSIALFLARKYHSYDIKVLDNLSRRGSELNINELNANDVEFIHGDIRFTEDLEKCGEIDILIDASAESSVLSGIDSRPMHVINTNLVGTINCLNYCLKEKAKILFLSTSRVYPYHLINEAKFIESKSRYILDESQDISGISASGISEELRLNGPKSFYGATKLASEFFIEEYSEFYHLDYTTTRFGVIAGPRQMGKIDQGIASFWLKQHYFQNELEYIGFSGKGKQVRDLLHIDDVVELMDMQIHKPKIFNKKTYNVGGGLINSCSLSEMTKICQKITGKTVPVGEKPTTRAADLKLYISDNSKIFKETGWKPKRNLDTIFEDMYEWIDCKSEIIKNL